MFDSNKLEWKEHKNVSNKNVFVCCNFEIVDDKDGKVFVWSGKEKRTRGETTTKNKNKVKSNNPFCLKDIISFLS